MLSKLTLLTAAIFAFALVGAAHADGPPVILVQGANDEYELTHQRMRDELIPDLNAAGHEAFIAPIFSNDNYANAQIIRSLAAEVHTLTGQKPHLLMHSMGGISGRRAIKNLGGAADIGGYIAIDTPHYGVWAACFVIPQLCPASGLMTSLNWGDDTPGKLPYCTIWTDSGLYWPLDGGASAVYMPGLDHSYMPYLPVVKAKVLAVLAGGACA